MYGVFFLFIDREEAFQLTVPVGELGAPRDLDKSNDSLITSNLISTRQSIVYRYSQSGGKLQKKQRTEVFLGACNHEILGTV